jgi:cellobiose dehydrogenase (acceptor)
MSRSFVVGSALFALHAAAQSATSYTDPNTGISFNGLQHESGYTLGYALPSNPTTDFIAQIQAPIANGGGWAGMPLGQSMADNLLIVAWPNDGEVLSSFRLAT